MTETGTDNEVAILSTDAEISKLQAALAEQAVTIMDLRSAGTSPAAGNAATGESNTNVNALTAPAPQTTAAKDDNDLDAIYENGKLKYTTSIFENLSKEYHPDLINLFNLMPSSKSKGIACL